MSLFTELLRLLKLAGIVISLSVSTSAFKLAKSDFTTRLYVSITVSLLN